MSMETILTQLLTKTMQMLPLLMDQMMSKVLLLNFPWSFQMMKISSTLTLTYAKWFQWWVHAAFYLLLQNAFAVG